MKTEAQEISSIEQLLGYASAMEREAAIRYTELAQAMEQHNNRDVAELFRRLADIEWVHAHHMGQMLDELSISPELATRPPQEALNSAEVPDAGELHYLYQPYHAIDLARKYEQRSAEFYAQLACTSANEELRTMALSFAAEEQAHLEELEQWLKRYPKPFEDWDDDPDPPAEQ